jgi:hypothetical protein
MVGEHNPTCDLLTRPAKVLVNLSLADNSHKNFKNKWSMILILWESCAAKFELYFSYFFCLIWCFFWLSGFCTKCGGSHPNFDNCQDILVVTQSCFYNQVAVFSTETMIRYIMCSIVKGCIMVAGFKTPSPKTSVCYNLQK